MTTRVRKADRFGRILERLAASGSVGVTDLARELGVSEATVRRDLRALDEQRLLERAHGGAISTAPSTSCPSVTAAATRARRSSGSRVPRWTAWPTATWSR